MRAISAALSALGNVDSRTNAGTFWAGTVGLYHAAFEV
jgi:hypothetical protein